MDRVPRLVGAICVAACLLVGASSGVAHARPPKPTRLHVVKVTRTSATIAWRRAHGRAARRRRRAVRRYVVRLDGARVAVLHRRRHRFKLRALRCDRRYRVAVRARGRHRRLSRPARLSVRTRRCSRPPQPHVAPVPRHPRVFAYYYLWWSRAHWHSVLGSHYPYSASPLPLPARLDASGCHPVATYPGATVTDVPRQLYSQDDAGLIASDVREAAAAGLAGFVVNWVGTGSASQTASGNPYSARLATMVRAVHQVNAEGIPFKLWLSYRASTSMRSESEILGDLGYIARTYGRDPAFDRAQSARLTVIWNGSRKYPVATLRDVATALRPQLRIIGDESSWSAGRARYLDGDAYYWSSQNPYANPQSFSQLRSLAAAVRGSGRNPDGSAKAWISPLAPGYDDQLAGGSACTPRQGGGTLRRLFAGNATTRPDAWALISWNEIVEGTYVDPMTRYGRQDLDVLHDLIASG